MARWEIYVCDALLQRQGQLDDYERLQAHTRHRNTGTWTLDLDGRSSSVAQLRRPGWGIDVVRDGASVFAGPARKVGRKRTATANQVTVAGWDDMVWLARRLAHPQPGTAAPPYSTTEYDIRTGTASTVIRAYVNVNAGPGAVEARRVPGLVLGADPLTGASISGEARWVNLLGFLRGLAVVGGDLGFRVARPDGGGLRFDVSAPRDLADDIKLSTDLGTLAEYGYETGEPTATWWVVGGGGEGAARTIREGGDQAAISSGYGRIESFVDRRDTTDSTALAQEIARQQAESAEASAVSITPIDISRMTYLDDYQLGDQVTTVVDDTVIVDVIREAELSLTPTEVRVTPKLGTEAKVDTTGIRIYRHMRALESRVAQLEARR